MPLLSDWRYRNAAWRFQQPKKHTWWADYGYAVKLLGGILLFFAVPSLGVQLVTDPERGMETLWHVGIAIATFAVAAAIFAYAIKRGDRPIAQPRRRVR